TAPAGRARASCAPSGRRRARRRERSCAQAGRRRLVDPPAVCELVVAHHLDAVDVACGLARDEPEPHVAQDQLRVALTWVAVAAPTRRPDLDDLPRADRLLR